LERQAQSLKFFWSVVCSQHVGIQHLLHFFAVHWLMHRPLMMRKVHYIHHQSKVPTVYSIYSFHWIEAVLLSSVPLTILPFLPISFVAVALYPIASVLINYAGHCNYRFGSGHGPGLFKFGTNHNEHHFRNKKNFGFLFQYFTSKEK
jgi:sterol desaturase/sphingolipid hydroxylase (fatty acid hydroxylase superfamily)